MPHILRVGSALVLVICIALSPLFAEPPQVAAVQPDKKTSPPAAPDMKKLDPLKLPADAVLILVNEATDALKMTAQSVRMSPEKYQALLDEIARLKAHAQAEKPVTPSKCQLKGKIDGNFALLQATFEFATEKPNTVVLLGCSPAQPTGVQLDGHTPLFKAETNGFSVQVEKPGDHQLALDLTLALTTRGNDRGFELELPRAPITNLVLALPGDAREVRVGGKPFAESLLKLTAGQLAGPLGPIEKLDVKWLKPGAAANSRPVSTATGRISVQLDDRETTTRAELTLKSEGLPTNIWRLVVPRGATVKLSKEDEPRLQNIQSVDQAYVSLRAIRLKEPVSELNVTVTMRGSQLRAGTLTPVGPFLLQNAVRQSGEIAVTSSLQDVKLEYHPHGDVEPAAGPASPPPSEGNGEGVRTFRYASIKLPDRAQATAGPTSYSLLDVEPRSTRGLVETSVQHVLRLVRDDARGRVWRVRTTIDAKPFRTGVDHLDVLMPPKCVYDDKIGPIPANLVRPGEFEPSTHVLRFKLAADPLKPFLLTFESEYQQPATETGKATFLLPKPQDTRDRGGQITVIVQDDLELLPPERPSSLEASALEPQQQMWRSRTLPEHIDVAWRPYQPQVQVSSIVDLTLTPREGQVRQTFRFQFPAHQAASSEGKGVRAPAQVTLRFPEAIADRWRIVRGGSVAAGASNAAVRTVKLTSPIDKEQGHVVVLEYTFALPGNPPAVASVQDAAVRTFTLPLAAPEQTSGGESKVRVWCEAGMTPSIGGGAWSDAEIEAVAEQPRLPTLVARAQRLDEPLRLRVEERSAAPNPVLVERVLVRVNVDANGLQTYRVSYLLAQLGGRELSVELPAPIPSLNLRVRLDKKDVAPETVDESGQRADGGRIARLRLPEPGTAAPRSTPHASRSSAVLEVSYQLQAQRTGSGALQTTLRPPQLRGDSGRPTTRWQVVHADGANLVVLWPDGGPGAELTLDRRGWLVGPRVPLATEDLERWFAGGYEAPPSADNEPSLPITATCWRQGVEPLTIVHVPLRAWLLTCSLTLVVLGMFQLLRARRANLGRQALAGWFWGFLALLPVAALIGLSVMPTLAAAIIYGCLPGAIVLLVCVVVYVIKRERQRRRVAFLPSFQRGGASVVRHQSITARHGEPSTVDMPRPNGSPWPNGEVAPGDSRNGSKAEV